MKEGKSNGSIVRCVLLASAAALTIGLSGCFGSGSGMTTTTTTTSGTTGGAKYKVADLGAQPGKTSVSSPGGPTAMNNATVVGSLAVSPGTTHPVYWTISGSASSISPTDLPTAVRPSNVSFSAWSINSAGMIVGDSYATPTSILTAAVWNTPTSTPTNLGAAAGDSAGEATALNASGGLIVGDSGNPPNYGNHALYWTSGNTIPYTMNLKANIVNVYISSVNASQQIIGGGYDSGGNQFAVFWPSPTGTQSILALPPGGSSGYANAINDSGLIVGVYSTGAGVQPVKWQISSGQPGTGSPLPLPATFTGGSANGANSKSVIVGSITKGALSHAALWDPVKGVLDLNSVVTLPSTTVLVSATAINDNGQVAGIMTVNGAFHAFLLTPLI